MALACAGFEFLHDHGTNECIKSFVPFFCAVGKGDGKGVGLGVSRARELRLEALLPEGIEFGIVKGFLHEGRGPAEEGLVRFFLAACRLALIVTGVQDIVGLLHSDADYSSSGVAETLHTMDVSGRGSAVDLVNTGS